MATDIKGCHRPRAPLCALTLAWIGLTLCGWFETARADEPTWTIQGLQLEGAYRTDERWVAQYLELEELPQSLTQEDLEALAVKLRSTDIFTSVEIGTTPRPTGDGYDVKITLVEKWTTIPVLRAAYGGGTPLIIAGIYDTHSLGRLLTLGAEARKYGDAAVGGVAFAKAPRWLDGRHSLGLEVWSERHLQDLWVGPRQIGVLARNTTLIRSEFLAPLTLGETGNQNVFRIRSVRGWQFGATLDVSETSHLALQPSEGIVLANLPRRIVETPPVAQSQGRLAVRFKLIRDSIKIDQLIFDGCRFILAAGPLVSESRNLKATAEGELFCYQPLGGRINFAQHAVAHWSSAHGWEDLRFLGGIDSVRGMHDGALFGSSLAYANAEVRYLAARYKYLAAQAVGFVDAAAIGPPWNDVHPRPRTALGIGLRISNPQIYRMMLRVDYGWSLDGAQGITAGFNHLFDPYRPL